MERLHGYSYESYEKLRVFLLYRMNLSGVYYDVYMLKSQVLVLCGNIRTLPLTDSVDFSLIRSFHLRQLRQFRLTSIIHTEPVFVS